MNTREMTKDEIPVVAKIMSEAFSHDPLYKYFVPNEAKRGEFIEEFMRFRLRFGMKNGKVIVTEDLSAVVVTLPPHTKMTQWDVLLMGGVKAILKAGGKTPSRLVEFENLAESFLNENLSNKEKYWTIGPLAVAPEAQGKGVGKTLLTAEMDKIKSQNQPCYIETQTEKNKNMYEKLGFEVIAEGRIENSGFINYLMILK